MTSHVATRKERLRKRRAILRRARAIAPECVLAGFIFGLSFGYWWAAQAYGRQPASSGFESGLIHHAPVKTDG